jgi:hypothetical protein
LTPTTLSPQFTFNPTTSIDKTLNNFTYNIPDSTDIEVYRNYIQTFPDIDSPEMFGLHPNADMTYRMKEVSGRRRVKKKKSEEEEWRKCGGYPTVFKCFVYPI